MSEKRILTLLVEVEKESNFWIWESHMSHEFINGVHVLAIGEGDQFEKIEDEE